MKSTGSNLFAKVMGGSYIFCCLSRITLTLEAIFKGFMKAFKAFIKPVEAQQRSAEGKF